MSERELQPLDGQRPCARCGKPFSPLLRRAKYCTAVCRQKAGREQARQKLKEKQA